MKGNGVHFGAVDATAHPGLKHMYQIKGFPTIKGFLPGKHLPIDYEGARKHEALEKWYDHETKQFVTPEPEPPEPPMYDDTSSVSILTDANFEKQVFNGEPWIVEFYAPVSYLHFINYTNLFCFQDVHLMYRCIHIYDQFNKYFNKWIDLYSNVKIIICYI